MGTRADFYLGRGRDARWLGSIAYDGYPDGRPFFVLQSRTKREYVANLRELASTDEYWTSPHQGWPWPWETSHTTDWAYAWDRGQCWASCFGRPWVSIRALSPSAVRRRRRISDAVYARWPEDIEDMPPDAHPKMVPPANPFHARSGLLVVSVRP